MLNDGEGDILAPQPHDSNCSTNRCSRILVERLCCKLHFFCENGFVTCYSRVSLKTQSERLFV